MLTRRLLVPAAGSTLVLLALAGPASAHVTVQGPGATQGGFTKFTFRVPTEKDVPTTKIEIAFPADHPIASLRVKPHPGWTAGLTKGKPAQPLEAFGSPVTEVVQRITWTAAPGNKGIAPDEFDEFEVSAGPLPETDTLTFKALQTYADGEVVRWIEEPAAGGEEPEHPAPTLKLAAATGDSGASAPASPQAEPAALASNASDEDDSGEGLSIAALVLSGLALLVGLGALLRRHTA
ncbi:MAG: hypothetical protein JWO60_347 [Frankiales bacterium]|nr:hypothetical protein [Frankiales bacterium]